MLVPYKYKSIPSEQLSEFVLWHIAGNPHLFLNLEGHATSRVRGAEKLAMVMEYRKPKANIVILKVPMVYKNGGRLCQCSCQCPGLLSFWGFAM